MKAERWLVPLLLLGAAPAEAGAPAKLKRAPESTLNQVILTKKAVERTGIVLAPVKRGKVPRTVRVAGVAEPRPGTGAVIAAPFAGVLIGSSGSKGTPLPGTTFAAGQTVLRLRPIVSPNQNLLTETKRDLTQAQARHANAEKAKKRADTLLKDGAGDRAGVDLAEEALALAKAELSAAQTRLARLKKAPLGADVSLPVRAPVGGMLTRIFVSVGQPVPSGAPLAELVDPTQLWVRAEVYAGMAQEVDPSASAAIYPLGGGASRPSLAAAVDAPPVAQRNGSVVDLYYALEKSEGLLPNGRVQVELTLRGSEMEVAYLPWSAVLYDAQGAAWVYAAVSETTFERRRVDIDAIVGDRAVLSRGPAQGTQIVSEGAIELFGTEFGIGK